MGNKLFYYTVGSYLYCYGEAFYRSSNHNKLMSQKSPFHCSTFASSAYVLSFVLLSPIVLPFHGLYFAHKYLNPEKYEDPHIREVKD